MKHNRLVNALTKAGLTITRREPNGMFQVKGPKYFVEWYQQNDSAVCVCIRRHDDVSDAMVDYHAGFFCRTIKSIVEYGVEK